MASMIADLLKTPAQVRMEQQGALREQGRKAAASLTGMPISGARTALPSMIQNLAASTAADIPLMADQMKRAGLLGLGGVAQLAGREDVQGALQQAALSPEERQAAQLNQLSGVLTSKDPAEIRQAAKKAEESGRPDIAAELISIADKTEQEADKATTRAAITKIIEAKDPVMAAAYKVGDITADQAFKAIRDPELKEIQNYVVDGVEFLGGMKGNDLINISTNEVVKGALQKNASGGTVAYKAPDKFTKEQLETEWGQLEAGTLADIEAMATTEGFLGLWDSTDEDKLNAIKIRVMQRANELRKQEGFDTPQKAIAGAINELQGAPVAGVTPSSDPYANKFKD